MKRLIITLTLILSLVLSFTAPVSANQDEIYVFIDGKRLDLEVDPVLINGRVLVPMRAIFEGLNFTVTWESSLQRISANRTIASGGNLYSNSIIMVINNNSAIVDGRTVALDVAPIVLEGTTFVPLRFIGEASEEGVEWDNTALSVYIGDPPESKPTRPNLSQPSSGNNYIYNLSDADIRQAISEGAKGMQRASEIDHLYRIVPSGEPLFANNSELRVYTPYLHIVRASAIAAARYETYSLEAAKKHNDQVATANQISFEIRLAETSFDEIATMSIAAFQGDKRITLNSVSGLSGFPDRSLVWPSSPSYVRTVNVSINQSEINVNAPITFKVDYLGTWELIFTVNLGNHK